MKFGDKSILEYMMKPFMGIKVINDYVGGNPRNIVLYEHAYGPVIIMSLLHWLPFIPKFVAWCILLVLHLVYKEIVKDWLIDKKPFNWPDVIIRGFSLILAGVSLL